MNDNPLLLLWAMADKLMPPTQLARWREAFPDAEFVPMDRVGHFVSEEDPEEASTSIRTFLDTSGSAPARAGPREDVVPPH